MPTLHLLSVFASFILGASTPSKKGDSRESHTGNADLSSHTPASQRIFKHTAFLSFSAAITKVLLIAFAVYACRKLGLAAFGRLEYFLNLVFIFVVLADFGLEQWTTRELARRQENGSRLIPSLNALRIVFTVAAALLMIGFLVIISKRHSVGLEGFFALLYLFSFSFQSLFRGMMRAYRLMGYEALLNLLEKSLTVLLGFGLLFIGLGVASLLGAFLFANLVILAISWILLRDKTHSGGLSLQTTEWAPAIKGSALFGIAAIFITIFYRQDTIMLKELSGDEASGCYRSAYRLVEGLWLLPQMLSVALYPVLSDLHHRRESLHSIIAGAARFLLAFSLPLAVGGTLVSKGLIAMLYPDNVEGGVVFATLVWTMPFVYGNYLVGTILAATDRQRINLYASIAAVVVNFVLNWFAIPRWGALGAAGVAVVTQAVFFFVMFAPSMGDWRGTSIRGVLWRTASACLLMGIAVGLAQPLGVIAQIVIGAIVYGSLAWRLGLVTPDDLRILKS